MDWVEEKVEKFKIWMRNLSFRKAMIGYILVLAVIVFILSAVTMIICFRWQSILLKSYDEGFTRPLQETWFMHIDPVNRDNTLLIRFLNLIRVWCPFIYGFTGMIITICIFYKIRLKKPFDILKAGTEEIKKRNLEFSMDYDSKDEMGRLCYSFEEMRQELIKNKNEMWELIENQKNLNAAFAHDLRTPLTVLRGYSDFLARYIPQGKVSQEKMVETLKLMSSHLERLEQYSRTMKGIRSLEEMPVVKEAVTTGQIREEIRQIIFALNQIGDIKIEESTESKRNQGGISEEDDIFVDKNIVLEVLENLLSNAIRYAGHSILVKTEWDNREKELLLIVKDDGPGFPEEKVERLMLPYSRETDKDKDHFGIGLHICRLLCEKHAGHLSLANSISTGAVVTASFSGKKELKKS